MVGLEKFLGFGPGQVNNGWTGKVSWFWSRAGGQRVGILIQRPGFFCWRVMPLDGG